MIKPIIMAVIFLLLLNPSIQAQKYYDLVVVGSDPEGVAAAVAGARLGLETILICHRTTLGGLMTVGGLNTLDMNYGPKRELLTRGIFAEFFAQVEGHSFDITTAEKVFNNMITTAGVELLLGVSSIEPVLWNLKTPKVIGVRYINDGEEGFLTGGTTIDATQDAEIAFLAGVDFTIGLEDFGGPSHGMGATLIFGVAGVDWAKLTNAIKNQRLLNTGADHTSAWGFWDEMQMYVPADPSIRFRGLNMGRQKDGSILINSMYIFGFYHLDQNQRQSARERGIAELNHLITFMREHIPGFAEAKVSFIANELYIRETRHMVALYRLTIDDVLEHRDFWDKIALGSYPVDIQDISLQHRGFVVGTPKIYSIPFRCLVPAHIDGLLVVGRSAGFNSLAHGSARVIPVGMTTAEAAATAAFLRTDSYRGQTWQILAQNESFITDLQTLLKKQGAYLPAFNVPFPLADHWAYPAIRKIRSLGMISAGYDNNYRLDDPVTPFALQNLFNNALSRYFGHTFPFYYSRQMEFVDLNEIARLFLQPLQLSALDYVAKARNEGLMPASLPPQAKVNPVDRATFYYLLAYYLERLAEIIPPPNTDSPS